MRHTPLLRLALLTAAAIAIHGYHYGTDDAAVYLPAIVQYIHPNLYPYGRAYFASHSSLSAFTALVGSSAHLTHLGIAWTVFLWHILTVFLFLLAAWRLATICFTTTRARLSAVMLSAATLTVPAARNYRILRSRERTVRKTIDCLIDHITLGGTAPSVAITSPGSGFVGTGTKNVNWTVRGATSFSSRLLYSPDNGTTWSPIGAIQNGDSFPVNFDVLPGSTQALIQVLVSDGVNTGSATSAYFSVPRKKPSVAVINSPTANFSQPAFQPIYLSGAVYDTDDGTLTGTALKWTSNIQGTLGTGSPLTTKLKAGSHTITLTGTDSDGNAISATQKVIIGGAPPVVTLNVQELNEAPTTCEFVTIGASAGASNGAPLASVRYSLDGGSSYTTIPLTSLPYGFLVPESGFVHLVANAADVSRQAATQDITFFAQSGCSLTPQTITFATIPSQTYGVAPITLHATASSGLPVTFTFTGPATLSGSVLKITGAGTVVVTASQAGNSVYAPANLVSQTVIVSPATLTAAAADLSKVAGTANPPLTYGVSGFVNGDQPAVVTGSATLTTTATTDSPAGEYPITFSTEALTSANYTFHYVPGTLTVTGSAAPTPHVSSLNQSYGAPYSVVILFGSNFGATQGASTVTYNGMPTPHYNWTDTRIYTTVPPDATSGNIVVTVGGKASNPVAFTVLPQPSLTGMSPTSGPAGTIVTLTGKNLADYENKGVVDFNGKPIPIISETSTAIKVAIPVRATTGTFHVVVNDTGMNTPTFTITK